MFQNVVAAFVGCFAAMVVLAEVAISNKWLKYLVALFFGALLAIILGLVLNWMVGLISHAHT